MSQHWARMACGLMVFGVSCAVAIAQPPGSYSAAPASAPDSSYLYGSNDPYYDDLETGWQYRFQADWIALKRRNSANDLPSMIGPDAFRLSDVDFNYKSGYRLNLGFMNEDYEIEGSFLDINGITGRDAGTLTKGLVFDGEATYNDVTTHADAQSAVDPAHTPNFLSSGTLFSPLNTAANTNIVGTDESTELEFLHTGIFAMRYASTLQDFDVNFKGRKQSGQLFRFGMGYRNIQFREAASIDLRGLFDTVDRDDGLEPDPNDGLSDTALTGAGLTSLGGGGGFTDIPPPGTNQTLLFTNDFRASNQLNGVQGTMDATFFESDYFELGGFARAGIYHNRANVSLREQYLNVTSGDAYRRSLNDEKDSVAFAGNLGINGLWILRENFRLFASYEMFYLKGVALAPDQTRGISTDIAGNTFLEARTNGSAFFHGGRVGFEILLP